MPLYEFRCEACGRRLELLVRSGPTPTVCGESCPEGRGDGVLTKVISRPAAVQRPESIGREGPSDRKIAESGFTKYVKEAPGRYRKTAGEGETIIHRPE